MARRSKAEIDRAMKKELARVRGAVTRLRNKGYYFSDAAIPTRGSMSKAKYAEILKGVTYQSLKESAIPKESRMIMDNAREAAAKYFSDIKVPKRTKGSAEYVGPLRQLKEGASRNVLNTHTLTYAAESEERRSLAIEKINNAVRIYGEEEVARMFKDYGEENVQDLINSIIYSSGTEQYNIESAFFELDRILSGEARTLEEAQAISEGLESW